MKDGSINTLICVCMCNMMYVTHTHTHTHIYIYIYIEREREREKHIYREKRCKERDQGKYATVVSMCDAFVMKRTIVSINFGNISKIDDPFKPTLPTIVTAAVETVTGLQSMVYV